MSSTSIKAIIVDDEENSRLLLQNLLQVYCPTVQVLALADGPATAFTAILQHQPDLIFLDVRMPSSDEGFQLLESLGNVDFAVIFTTSYDEYAIRAIKFAALDYLLKPINILELQQAVQRFQQQQQLLNTNAQKEAIGTLAQSTKQNYFEKIGLPSLEGLTFVHISQIVHCEADGNCTIFHLLDKRKILVTKTLKYYDELLHSKGFHRVHGSYLVNLKHVLKYYKEGTLEMSNGATVFVSARKKKAFLARLQSLE